MNTPVWTLQDRIRKARDHAGLTQGALANIIGVSLNSVNRWETGERNPSAQSIAAIAAATNIPLEWFTKDDAAEPPLPLEKLPPGTVIRWTPEGFKISHDS